MRKAAALRGMAAACALLSHLLVHQPCEAAPEPRDAIRHLPEITVTNVFTTTDPGTSAETRPFEDKLVSTIDILWAPPQASLPGGFLVKPTLQTSIGMLDSLDRSNRVSTDNRVENFNFVLRLDKPGLLESSYSFRRGDIWSANSNSASRNLQSTNDKIFNLALTLPNFPRVAVSASTQDSYPPGTTGSVNGSSVSSASLEMKYRREFSGAVADYSARTSSTQSTVFTNGVRTDNGTTSNSIDAVRQLSLGQAGNLTLTAHYDDYSKTSLASQKAELTQTSRYNLNLNGAIANFPASYTVQFTHFNQIPPNNQGTRSVGRLVKLSLKPPVPQGKRASLDLSQEVTDTDDPNQRIAITRQSIAWGFSTNPRTSGQVNYGTVTSINLDSQEQTQNDENINFNLNYQIPGDRGNLVATYGQSSQRPRSTGASAAGTDYSFANSFKLGERANMTLFLEQHYRDNGSRLWSSLSTDTLRSGFTYSLSSNAGYNMSATWENWLSRTNPGQTRENNQTLRMSLSYRPQRAWEYRLDVTSKGNSKVENYTNWNSSYLSSDIISATVTYTF